MLLLPGGHAVKEVTQDLPMVQQWPFVTGRLYLGCKVAAGQSMQGLEAWKPESWVICPTTNGSLH